MKLTNNDTVMVKEFEDLSSSEVELLMEAPLLVCILIAGADNKIDEKEIREAIVLSKTAKAKASLAEFYRTAAEDFEDKLKILLQSLPKGPAERNLFISQQLSQLNALLKKIKQPFASDFYISLLFIAKKIAESSGGVLGLNSVGEEEMKLLRLPMIKDPSL